MRVLIGGINAPMHNSVVAYAVRITAYDSVQDNRHKKSRYRVVAAFVAVVCCGGALSEYVHITVNYNVLIMHIVAFIKNNFF